MMGRPSGVSPPAHLVPDLADVVAGRVEVHVDLLDDHALLALELLLVEARVQEHVGEDVDRDRRRPRGALDVVGGQLLAREGVELAADAVDLAGDVARGGAPLGALEEHVLGEVRDARRLGPLEAGAGGDADDDGHARRVAHGRGEHPHAVVEGAEFEHGRHGTAASTERAERGGRVAPVPGCGASEASGGVPMHGRPGGVGGFLPVARTGSLS